MPNGDKPVRDMLSLASLGTPSAALAASAVLSAACPHPTAGGSMLLVGRPRVPKRVLCALVTCPAGKCRAQVGLFLFLFCVSLSVWSALR